jgi:hypothetical protein
MKAAKDADARTDVWALGIILYECLTGRRPFDAEAFSAVVLMAATEPPPPMDRRIPRALQAAVLRCLEKRREARFSSMAELAAALAPFARDQRAAAVIVDRTGLLARGASPASEHTAGRTGSPTATTLSGSAGASQVRVKRRSYAIIGVTSLLVSIGGVALVVRAGSERRAVTGAASAVEGDVAAPVALDAAVSPRAQPIDASEAGGERARRAKADECSGLKGQREWQSLEDCADALERFGGDEAAGFRTTARRERANMFSAHQLQDALRAGNLKSSQTWLDKIDADSVYFASARDELARAETVQSESAVRKAKGLARLQQCDALERYVFELNATSTERIAAAVRTVGCTRAVSPPGASAATKPPSPPPACEGVDTENLVERAGALYSDGEAKVALGLVLQALECRRDDRMLRFAVTYACVAHDLANAKLYFAKVADRFKANLEQKCQQEGLNVRAP